MASDLDLIGFTLARVLDVEGVLELPLDAEAPDGDPEKAA